MWPRFSRPAGGTALALIALAGLAATSGAYIAAIVLAGLCAGIAIRAIQECASSMEAACDALGAPEVISLGHGTEAAAPAETDGKRAGVQLERVLANAGLNGDGDSRAAATVAG
jgi:hypothetical protein